MKTVILLSIVSLTILTNAQDIDLMLPATVSIKTTTNVVNGDNSSGCNLCFDGNGHSRGSIPATYGMEPCKPYLPASEKWTITNVVKHVTVTIKWGEKTLTHNEETTLSSTTNRWKLNAEWKKE